SGIEAVNEIGKGAVQVVVDEATYVLPLADVIDVSGEKVRLEKEIAKFDKKLANQGFLAKAPAEVVTAQRERREKAAADRARRTEALERLAAM
ncbi:MAG TPA: valine--tRNA ligase, partial [Rhodospirillales bacterium]|nr:valine--tRNA ligase [Rhodospirillales bacterium]